MHIVHLFLFVTDRMLTGSRLDVDRIIVIFWLVQRHPRGDTRYSSSKRSRLLIAGILASFNPLNVTVLCVTRILQHNTFWSG